ncbi:hypothetical protein LINPERHAP1_LOCUS23224 [Linum perenne]
MMYVHTLKEGRVYDGRSGLLSCSSPIVAEARAILEAVSWASTNHSRCVILTDCLTLVSSLSDPKHRWP